MRRFSLSMVAPLALVLLFGFALPGLVAVRYSFLRWSLDQNDFSGPLSFDAYRSFSDYHRGGEALRTFLLALAATLLTLVFGMPIVCALRLHFTNRFLTFLELVFIVPFFLSSPLRIHSLKMLLSGGGFLARTFQGLGLPAYGSRILFSDWAVVLGLCLSYSAYMLLPLIQGLKHLPPTIVPAIIDTGQSPWAGIRMLIHLNRSGLAAGAMLMTFSGWSSSLEYTILGKGRSLMELIEGLVAVNKYPEVYAFGVVPFFVGAISLLLFMSIGRPERLLGVEREQQC